jgi:formiminotetrahydrofolate cyclodeaminase
MKMEIYNLMVNILKGKDETEKDIILMEIYSLKFKMEKVKQKLITQMETYYLKGIFKRKQNRTRKRI